MAYTWSDDMKTGNTMIDIQHKQLIQAVNDLLAACASGQGRTEIGKTLDFLSAYTEKHFADEEKLQLQYKYPDYPRHKKLHDGFKQLVHQLAQQLKEQGPTVSLVSKVNTQIGDWLVNHIKKEDMKVAAHIRR
jgi:hemerythrin